MRERLAGQCCGVRFLPPACFKVIEKHYKNHCYVKNRSSKQSAQRFKDNTFFTLFCYLSIEDCQGMQRSCRSCGTQHKCVKHGDIFTVMSGGVVGRHHHCRINMELIII